jgi:YbgC/YbaW family acyl-CoA thioester hydrolase
MFPPGTRTFRIRRYECDAYGHLNNTAYLRYLEEVEIEAGLDGGGDPGVRTTDIQFVQPVSFGDEVTVIAESMRESLRRSYQFQNASTGETVARATAEWGNPDSSAESVIPPPPEPPEAVFVQRRLVEWRDVDQTARVSPATLSAFAEDCGVDLCADYGWPMQRCTDEGFAMVLRRHQILYGQPLSLGDELEITTFASDLRRVTAIRHYLLASGGKPVARFRSQYVWVDIDTMRPIRIPARFLEDFRPNFSCSRESPVGGPAWSPGR